MDIGNRIKILRENKNISQRMLAIKSGLSAGNISRLEKNEINPTINSLEKIATALNIRITDLFEEDEKPYNNLTKRLVNAFNKMNPANQNSLITFAEYSVSQQQKIDQNKQVK